jgi:molybdopterin molybdotransferase
MSPQRTRLTPAAAVATILGEIDVLPHECIPLRRSAGRVLAEEVRSPFDLPRWDNSAMDGYAVRSGDVGGPAERRERATGPIELEIVEEIPAGAFATKALGPGQCARIFTGAPIPDGADCVIRQEHTTRIDERTVRIDELHDVGRNVRRRGEDIAKGTVVFRPGAELGPAQIGVLASLACADVDVYRRPRVALLGTGDEIADLTERDAILEGRKIASSNSYTMLAMAEAAGAEPIDLGIAPDDPEAIRARLERVQDADLLVTSGGMSVGEHDHLRAMLQQGGAELLFWRLRMRPGAPVGFGRYGSTPWLGLPGNPVSTMVTFELFVRPAIRKLLGHTTLFRRTTPVRVGERITMHAALQHFLRVTLAVEAGELTARLTGPQGSGILSSMAKAEALMIVPEDKQEIAEGVVLPAILLNEPVHVERVPY